MKKHAIRFLLAVILVAALSVGTGCAAPSEPEPTIAEVTALPATEAPTEPTAPAGITLGGREYDAATETLTIRDPDFDELYQKLSELPCLTAVTLEGQPPATEQLAALKEAYPAVTFLWEFEVCGVTVNTLTESIDLSGIPLENTEELEAALPCFYNLQTVDMCGCGLSNEEMDALNHRHEQTLFVWEVQVGRLTVRTDATYFMPIKYGVENMVPGATENLKYCTELIVIDLGHFAVEDISFVRYMPKLRSLTLNGCRFTDLSPVGTCTKLEFLELFLTKATDLWPLTNCTALKDLNISYMPYSDPTPLYQMTWLDRLWLANCRLSAEEKESLSAALPNTTMLFNSASSTDKGWRSSPGYFKMRDFVGGSYMVK